MSYYQCHHLNIKVLFIALLFSLLVAARATQSDSTKVSKTVFSKDPLQWSEYSRTETIGRRAQEPGTKITVNIPGTIFVAEISTTNGMAGVSKDSDPALSLAEKIASDAQGQLSPSGIPAYDVWPTSNMLVKFELRRHDLAVKRPPITKSLLQGMSTVIKQHLTQDDGPLKDYLKGYFMAFSGSIIAAGQPQFTFRAFHVPAQAVQSEKAHDVEFGAQDLHAIFDDIKPKILQHTNANDLLLFVGNTGAYIYHAFPPNDPTPSRRNTALLPVSGLGGSWNLLWNRNGLPFSTEAGVLHYKTSVLDPIFTRQRPDPRSGGRIILIDHSRTGTSLDLLASEISWHNLLGPREKIYYINLRYRDQHHDGTLSVWSATWLADIVVEDDKHIERLDLGRVGRVLPYYCTLLWEDNWQDVPNPDAQWAPAILRQIQARAAQGPAPRTVAAPPSGPAPRDVSSLIGGREEAASRQEAGTEPVAIPPREGPARNIASLIGGWEQAGSRQEVAPKPAADTPRVGPARYVASLIGGWEARARGQGQVGQSVKPPPGEGDIPTKGAPRVQHQL
ncbi:hypothetical protein MMC13_000496 [Lambiella insularis]|nr:hypothetical protein [Lambiella insularis]